MTDFLWFLLFGVNDPTFYRFIAFISEAFKTEMSSHQVLCVTYQNISSIKYNKKTKIETKETCRCLK